VIDIRNNRQYIEAFLKIRTKDNRIELLRLNQPQEKLYGVIKREHQAGKPIRIIILKARQMGFSTLTEAVMFQRSATREVTNGMIVAHTDDATTNLHNMNKLFFEELPEPIKPMKKASNAKELVFENPTADPVEKKRNPGLRSRIRCATAGGKGIGRSFTITNLHVSEYGFWPGDKNATITGLLQAVPPKPGTIIIIESTANGFDDFKKRWDAAVAGESDFIPVFFAWFEMNDYRMPVPPGTVWTEEELALKARHSLDDEQLQWRRWCIKNNCGGDIKMFHQEYPSTPDEAFIYSGTGVFDNEIIVRRREEVKDLNPRRGEFTYDTVYDDVNKEIRLENIKFIERADGIIRIYGEPQKGHPYVIGGDTAGEGSDWFAAHCIDNTTGELCAVLHQRSDEDLYAKQLYCLGLYYNKALLGPEANFSTYPIKVLESLRYQKLYVREREDTFSGTITKAFGFETTSLTRPIIIASLVKLMRETPECCCDFDTLGEMLTFVYNDKRRPEAMIGEHDDLVMSLAITHYIRTQQQYLAEVEEPEKRAWTKDMTEDYNRASPEMRRELRKKWGRPQ
jgi:hypothetical protein